MYPYIISSVYPVRNVFAFPFYRLWLPPFYGFTYAGQTTCIMADYAWYTIYFCSIIYKNAMPHCSLRPLIQHQIHRGYIHTYLA